MSKISVIPSECLHLKYLVALCEDNANNNVLTMCKNVKLQCTFALNKTVSLKHKCKCKSIPHSADIKLNRILLTTFYSMFNRQTNKKYMVTSFTFSVTVRTDARKLNAGRTVIRSSFDKHMTLKTLTALLFTAVFSCPKAM